MVSFFIYMPFCGIFIKKWLQTRDCNFQYREPIMEGCKELHRAAAANPEEVGVGTDPNID